MPFSRQELEDYLAACGLDFVNDSSNASDAHRRNRLRNNIFPLIEEQFPGATDAILRTMGNLERMELIYREAVAERISPFVTDRGIDLKDLAATDYCDTVLFEYLKPRNFNYTQVCDMLAAASSSGKSFYSTDGSCMAEIDRGILTVTDLSRSRAADSVSYEVNPRHDILSPVHIKVGISRRCRRFIPRGLVQRWRISISRPWRAMPGGNCGGIGVATVWCLLEALKAN